MIPRWQNISKARPAGDTGGTHYTATPYPRNDQPEYDFENGPGSCAALPAGSCGGWLVGGDLNGLSAQEIEDTVNDIMTCAGDDTTHAKIDHNCYIKSPVETAGGFEAGRFYQIKTLGSTDWHAIGASTTPKVGDVFTASGVGSGDGTAQQVVDLRMPKLFGGLWVFARKYWHGSFGWNSNDACAKSPLIAADQTKYLKLGVDCLITQNSDNGGYGAGQYTGKATGNILINRTSGIITNSVITSEDLNELQTIPSPPPRVFVPVRHVSGGAGWQARDANHGSTKRTYVAGMTTDVDAIFPANCYCSNTPLAVRGPFSGSVSDQVTAWNAFYDYVNDPANADLFPVGTFTITRLSAVTDINSYSSSAGCTGSAAGVTPGATASISVSWSRSATVFTATVTHQLDNGADITDDYNYALTFTLSDPYTSADCYEDFKAALAALDMSDLNLAKLRQDEKLALAPLCVFDEVGPATPQQGLIPATMNDYSSTMINDLHGNAPGSTSSTTGQNDDWGRAPSNPDFSGAVDYVPTWPQRAWLDPNSYQWLSPSGGFTGVPDVAGGNQLKTGLRDGSIIAHTQPGSDRHFWFGYEKLKRIAFVDPITGPTGEYSWVNDTWGGFSESPLPPVAVRWMNGLEAQYDGLLHIAGGGAPPPGNFPQGWLYQKDSRLVGGKYCEATQKWPSVNFGRPCGADKYAVDQPSVCCITGGDATSGFTVKKTGNAIAPLASGGLAVNDYIVVEADGIYKISGITDNGTSDWDGTGDPYQRFTVTVGSKLDDLPTGYNFSDPEQTADDVTHLGRMRFPTASGICGRAAITTAYAGGTVTITPTVAQPWLRKDPTTGTILVDVYDASMTLVASALSLTRVSDTSFTIVHAAMATAVWMTGHGVNWTHYDATPKKTGVHLEWSFNQRALDSRYPSPPSWYGGIGGCLACSVTQFTYSSGACPAAIGIVPFYSPLANTSGELPDQNSQPPGNEPMEQFPNQEMFDFPATVIFDDVFGAHWQAAVMLTMPDPFWQQPFKPDCFIVSPDAMRWNQDDGTGQDDTSVHTDSLGDGPGFTVYTRYYAHHPLVEALSTIPAGMSLPAGVSLLYDPAANVIAPPFYPTGIPIGDNAGNYSSIEMDWGFTLRVCGNVGGRFRTEYNFVAC